MSPCNCPGFLRIFSASNNTSEKKHWALDFGSKYRRCADKKIWYYHHSRIRIFFCLSFKTTNLDNHQRTREPCGHPGVQQRIFNTLLKQKFRCWIDWRGIFRCAVWQWWGATQKLSERTLRGDQRDINVTNCITESIEMSVHEPQGMAFVSSYTSVII